MIGVVDGIMRMSHVAFIEPAQKAPGTCTSTIHLCVYGKKRV